MVDDIHIPKGLPPVSASGQIRRVNRKKRDDDKPPFENYLRKDDEEEKKKHRKKKKSDTVDVTGQDSKSESSGATETAESNDTDEPDDAAERKIIDVRV
ncbi:MAG: hypothetical protein PVI93_20780 [Desulfobacterales bacterium]|jgi:hypothetical protein